MRRAIVLGSGGVTGGAWEIGVLKGLRDAGIEPSQADVLVGTSVGALLAALLRSGRDIEDVYNWRITPPESGTYVPIPERTAEEQAYFRDCSSRWESARRDVSARIDLGRRALMAPNPIAETFQIDAMRRIFQLDGWPSGEVRFGAVDVADGSVCFLDAASGADVHAAMAASCAQPGLSAPIVIGVNRYVDGGIGGTGVDGAIDCDVVIAVTAFPAGDTTQQEIARVRDRGGEVASIVPDTAAREAMGPSIMDYAHARSAAEAGVRQGRQLAVDVRDLWGG